MKNTKRCPKCGSGDILLIPGRTGAYGSGNNIPVGITVFSAVLVNRYLCGTCGYSEEWIHREDLERLRKKYELTPTEWEKRT